MAQRGREWLSPMVFDFACNPNIVETWLEKMLLPELTKPSIVIMDNASFHNKENISQLLEEKGHICEVPCDHVPIISYPLFKARSIFNDLIQEERARRQ
jgi:hypothetical protein